MMIREFTSLSKMIKSSICAILLAVSNVHCNVTSTCGQREICSSFLDVAIDMITKAKQNIPICNNCPKAERKPVDCADVLEMGHTTNGIYEIWPMNRITEEKSLNVYCDMETDGGGWTVFQRRGDFQVPKDYFYRDWKSYKEGFGYMDKDFWLGNDNIFALTTQKLNSVRFDMRDVRKNKRFAVYDTFWIDDEDHKYTLHISEYTGDAEGESEAEEHISKGESEAEEHISKGESEDDYHISDASGDGEDKEYFLYRLNSENKNIESERYRSHSATSSDQAPYLLGDSMKLHNNQAFSTHDRDNDNQSMEHCAEKYKGAWWYNNCHHANLNGLYHKGRHLFPTHDGTTWVTFKGLDESLLWTEIKIRPKHFKAAFL